MWAEWEEGEVDSMDYLSHFIFAGFVAHSTTWKNAAVT